MDAALRAHITSERNRLVRIRIARREAALHADVLADRAMREAKRIEKEGLAFDTADPDSSAPSNPSIKDTDEAK